MTIPKDRTGSKSTRRRQAAAARSDHWLLQDAKARFSELVRRVCSEGPQRVTVHGREMVVVVSTEDFRRFEGERTGAALIAAMQAVPHQDLDIDAARGPMPVRDADLCRVG